MLSTLVRWTRMPGGVRVILHVHTLRFCAWIYKEKYQP